MTLKMMRRTESGLVHESASCVLWHNVKRYNGRLSCTSVVLKKGEGEGKEGGSMSLVLLSWIVFVILYPFVLCHKSWCFEVKRETTGNNKETQETTGGS